MIQIIRLTGQKATSVEMIHVKLALLHSKKRCISNKYNTAIRMIR